MPCVIRPMTPGTRMCHRLRVPARFKAGERFTAATDVADSAGRVPDHKVEVFHRARNDGSHSDHGEPADRQIGTDDCAGSDRGAGKYERRPRVFVRRTGAQNLDLGISRAREAVVRKNSSSADHHAVFDRHACADINERVDLDQIPDPNVITDVRLFPDDYVVADNRVMPDVNVIPDRGALPEPDAVLNQSCLVDVGVHAAAITGAAGEAAVSSAGIATQESVVRAL